MSALTRGKNSKEDDQKVSARDRLSGVLQSAINKADNDVDFKDLGVFGSALDSPLRRFHNSDSPWGSPTKSPSRSGRRRRKKELPVDTAFHHTFVMKLFDRSVDLAQFQEDTALYPVCRAWMKNQPHNTNMAPRLRTPTPGPVETKTEEPKEETESEENKEDPQVEEQLKNIYKMPEFTPLEDEENTLRIPSPLPVKLDEQFDINKDQTDAPAPAALLSDHMVKWFQVRKRWKAAAGANEARYEASTVVLRNMFEK